MDELDQLVKEIEVVLAKTTNEPWVLVTKGNTVQSYAINGVCSGISPKTGNGVFISKSRTWVPQLLTVIGHLKYTIKALQELLDRSREIQSILAKEAEKLREKSEYLALVVDSNQWSDTAAKLFREKDLEIARLQKENEWLRKGADHGPW